MIGHSIKQTVDVSIAGLGAVRIQQALKNRGFPPKHRTKRKPPPLNMSR